VRRKRLIVSVVLLAGLAFGALSIAIARREPAYAFAGGSIKRDTPDEIGAGWLLSPARVAAELAAGWALLMVGVVAWARRPRTAFGPLLVAASFGWFAREWNNPGIGSAAGFAVGLTIYAAAPPLVAHAALVYPNRGLPALERLVVALAYVNALLVLGLAPALAFDPDSGLCTECPVNPLLVDGSSRAFDASIRAGVHLGLGWSTAAVLLVGLRLARASPAARRSLSPVLLPAAAYLGLVAWSFADSLEHGVLGTSTTQRDLWLGQAVALVALGGGVIWVWLRARSRRGEVARLVLDGVACSQPGELRVELGRVLGDPSVRIAYPLEDGRLVDAHGALVTLGDDVTPLVRGGETVALLSHRRGLLDDPTLAEEVASAARLALEHERLQAELRIRLEELQTSRRRVIAAGDAERHRLERDLHDGAQQRFTAVLLRLGLLRSTDDIDLAQIEEAEHELHAALARLRELGHGLFPALLAEEGLAVALEALTEEAPVEIEIGPLPDERLDPGVEAAAYFLVSEALKRSRAVPERVAVRMEQERLVVEIGAEIPAAELVGLEDRIGAAGGSLTSRPQPDGRIDLRAELPCAS
jgi:signal transduction histidine kinase